MRLPAGIDRRFDDLRYAFRKAPLRVIASALVVLLILAIGACALLAERASYRIDVPVPEQERRHIAGIDFSYDYAVVHRLRQYPAIVDATGRHVGLLSPALLSSSLQRPPYLTTAPGPLPPQFWPLVTEVEDSNRRALFHVWGVDLKGIARALLVGGSGGSTIEMQLVKSLHVDCRVIAPLRS